MNPFALLRRLLPALLLVLPASGRASADPVQLSFLNDQAALQDTLGLLRKNHCGDLAVTAFESAVRDYNTNGLPVDVSQFPKAENGFYAFPSVPRVLSLLPHRLCDVSHPFGFNCFDSAIVAASGELRTDLRPDEPLGGFLPAGSLSNGHLVYSHASTAREAFSFSYPSSYQDVSEKFIPPALVERRISLTAAFYCFHSAPAFTNEQNIAAQTMQVLRDDWKRQKIVFPTGFQTILCHQIHLTENFFPTTHAGLLFSGSNCFTYLEKAGGTGPFVRLDFHDRDDLLAWLSAEFEKKAEDYVFATFNDREIRRVPIR